MKTGQEVVCIRGVVNPNTNDKAVEGKTYIIHNLSKCNCSALVDIGFRSNNGTLCKKCNSFLAGNVWWLYADRFVPIDEIDISEIEQILQPRQLEEVN